jgi:hypothetical protein
VEDAAVTETEVERAANGGSKAREKEKAFYTKARLRQAKSSEFQGLMKQ